MSFSHYEYETIPRSTLIKEDMLFSFLLMEKMEKTLTKYEQSNEKNVDIIKYIPVALEKVVKVFNENITYINQQCASFKRGFDYPSFNQWKEGNSFGRSEQKVREEYEDDKSVAEYKHRLRLFEAVNIGQVGMLFPDFKNKIKSVTERALAQKLPVEELPKLIDLMQFEAGQLLIYDAHLREPYSPAKKNECTSTSTISQSALTSSTSSASSAPSATEQAEISLLPQRIESTQFVSATIKGTLPNGKALAICHDPSWDSPVLFAATNQGWEGPIPFNREFKFVIVQDGKVIEWEKDAGNRSIKPDSSLPNWMNPPSFSSFTSEESASSFVVDLNAFDNQSAEVPLPQPAATPTSTVLTVKCPMDNDGVLGICHEPSWVEAPVMFTLTNDGWQGQIPAGVEFKYVIIENGKITKWEGGPNRSNKADSTIPFNPEEPPRFVS